MKERLRELKSRKFIGVVELADEAAKLIADIVPRQDRASVAEVPDERIVRYYSAEGLISSPEGRQGTAAVYGYVHLLQLLVIKRLQADHLPIRKIKELVEGKTASELEKLLGVGQRSERDTRSKNTASEFLESLVASYRMKSPAPASDSAPPPAPQGSLQRQRKSEPLGVKEPPSVPYAQNSGRLAWTRLEIEPGLELHLRGDYQLPDDARDRQRLARRIIAEIENNVSKSEK